MRPSRRSSAERLLAQQVKRLAKLKMKTVSVQPRLSGQAIIDSPLDAIYELTQVSATRCYLRFFPEVTGEDTFGSVIGELCHDWAVNATVRTKARIVVERHAGAMLLQTEEGTSNMLASSATSFQMIYKEFVEFRRHASKLDYDEFDFGFLTEESESLYDDLTRRFWKFVADCDPKILNSGSQFWAEVVRDALLWRN